MSSWWWPLPRRGAPQWGLHNFINSCLRGEWKHYLNQSNGVIFWGSPNTSNSTASFTPTLLRVPFKREFYIVSPTFPETFKISSHLGHGDFLYQTTTLFVCFAMKSCTQIHFDKRNHPSTNLGGATPPENHYRTQIYGGVKDDFPFQLGDVNLPCEKSRGVQPTSCEGLVEKGDWNWPTFLGLVVQFRSKKWAKIMETN